MRLYVCGFSMEAVVMLRPIPRYEEYPRFHSQDIALSFEYLYFFTQKLAVELDVLHL